MRPWRSRQIVAALALLLFAVQGYVTQTHIHLLGREAPNAIAQTIGARLQGTPAPGKSNPFDNPATCPICQDLALTGHFTTPAVLALVPPAQIVLPVATMIVLPAVAAAVSHIWHGRAPPQL